MYNPKNKTVYGNIAKKRDNIHIVKRQLDLVF